MDVELHSRWVSVTQSFIRFAPFLGIIYTCTKKTYKLVSEHQPTVLNGFPICTFHLASDKLGPNLSI